MEITTKYTIAQPLDPIKNATDYYAAVDAVTDSALKQNGQSLRMAMQPYAHTDQMQALDNATATLISQLDQKCHVFNPTNEAINPNDRLAETVKQLFQQPITSNREVIIKEAQPILNALWWIREKRIELGMPRVIIRLRKMATLYFTNQTITYDRVLSVKNLIETMLLTTPNTLTIQAPDKQFIEDIRSIFNITPENNDIGLYEYIHKVNAQLYYLQLLLDSILAIQELYNRPDNAPVDIELALEIAPIIIKPVAMARDEIFRALAPMRNQQHSPTILDHGQTGDPVALSNEPPQPQELDIV